MGSCIVVNAQQSITMYNMINSNASSSLNPSRIPESKWQLGIPGLSNVNASYSNSGFHFNNLIKVVNDSMQIDYEGALGSMRPHNFIGINANVQLLSFGLKFKKNKFFSFNVGLKNTINFRYDREPLELVIVGNGPFINTSKKINFETNSSSYFEYAFGFAKTYSKNKVGFGGKLKILSGIANINTKKNDLYFKTNNENYGLEITSDIDFKTAGSNNPNFSPIGPNLGAAIDFGFFYKWKKNIEFSGSILDLGAIRWKDDVVNYRSDAPGETKVFEGVKFSDFFNEEDDYKKAMELLLDSLQDEFGLDENSEPYTSSIPTQLYMAVNYDFRKNTTLGFVFYSHFFKSRPIPGVGISLNQEVFKGVNLMTSYSYYNKEAANIGLGLNLNLGCLQWSVVTDNALSYMEYSTANNLNLRTSLSFQFGRESRLPKYIRKQNKFHKRNRGGRGNYSF